MIRKKTFISIYILISVSLISILALTNSNKTSINLFRWNTKEIRVGNLITISFLSGFVFSTLFTLNNLQTNHKNKFELIFKIDANDKIFFGDIKLNLPVDFNSSNFIKSQ